MRALLRHAPVWQSHACEELAIGAQAKALEMTACVEVATGFMLVLMLLTAQRSILLCACAPVSKQCQHHERFSAWQA